MVVFVGPQSTSANPMMAPRLLRLVSAHPAEQARESTSSPASPREGLCRPVAADVLLPSRGIPERMPFTLYIGVFFPYLQHLVLGWAFCAKLLVKSG